MGIVACMFFSSAESDSDAHADTHADTYADAHVHNSDHSHDHNHDTADHDNDSAEASYNDMSTNTAYADAYYDAQANTLMMVMHGLTPIGSSVVPPQLVDRPPIDSYDINYDPFEPNAPIFFDSEDALVWF